MIQSADINKLKFGDVIEVEFGGFAIEGRFIRYHDSEIGFTRYGSVITVKPNQVNYINGVPIVR